MLVAQHMYLYCAISLATLSKTKNNSLVAFLLNPVLSHTHLSLDFIFVDFSVLIFTLINKLKISAFINYEELCSLDTTDKMWLVIGFLLLVYVHIKDRGFNS